MASDLSPQQSATAQATKLAKMLLDRGTDRIVFAESCTAGLVSALLAQAPGISAALCGSAVTYQPSVKTAWLDVNEQTLEAHTAESLATTREMARGVLAKTNAATISAAVTGHLGPRAPSDLDGKIFIVVARTTTDIPDCNSRVISEESYQLKHIERVERQLEAAEHVLVACCKALAE